MMNTPREQNPSDDRVSHDSEPSEEAIRRTRKYRPPYEDDRLDLLDHWCPSEHKCPGCRNDEWSMEGGHAPPRSTRHPFAIVRDCDRPRLPPSGPRVEGPRRWHPYDPSRRRVKENMDPKAREGTISLTEKSRRPATLSEETQKESEDMS
jgi:hypothetical protein